MPRKPRIDAPGALHHKTPVEAVWAAGKHHKTVAVRSLLCNWSVRQLGVSLSSLARRLGIPPTAVSPSVTRGEMLAKKYGYLLLT